MAGVYTGGGYGDVNVPMTKPMGPVEEAYQSVSTHIGGLRKRIAELEAENGNLRETLFRLRDICDGQPQAATERSY